MSHIILVSVMILISSWGFVKNSFIEMEGIFIANKTIDFLPKLLFLGNPIAHYNDVIMSARASQITSFTIVYSTVYSGAFQRKHQRSTSLASVRGIHRWPVNFRHKGPVTRRKLPFVDVIMAQLTKLCSSRLSSIGSSDNCSTRYWQRGSLHTLRTGGHI